jgi:hypothetical protein
MVSSRFSGRRFYTRLMKERGKNDSEAGGSLTGKNIQIRPLVRSMRDTDGAILLDLKGGKYYSLNGVGAHIWDFMEKGAGTEEILSHLAETYGTPRETLERDLLNFVTALEAKGLVQRGEKAFQ